MEDDRNGRRHATILSVEDQALMREILRGFLQCTLPGGRFQEAQSGARLLAACKVGRPDRVLMDKRLPDADCTELLPACEGSIPAFRLW